MCEEKKVLGILVVLGVVALAYGFNRPALESGTRPKEIYTISCESDKGWVRYNTKKSPYDASNRAGGVWHFETVSGDTITATNCYADEI